MPDPSPLNIGLSGWQGLVDAAQQAGEFITADPSTLGPLGRVGQAAGQAACNAYGNAPDVIKQAPGAINVGLGEMCKPYFDGNGYDLPAPPFSGGQCAGVLYDVTSTAVSTTTGIPNTRTDENEIGPISFTPSANGGGTIRDGNGTRIRSITDGSSTLKVDSVVRSDGLPDTCGDPPSQPGNNPPPPYNYGDNIDIPDFPQTVNGPPSVTVGEPYIAPNGDVVQPVCIDGNCFNLLGGTSGGAVPPKGDRPTGTGDPLTPDDLGSDPGEEGDFPDPPPGTQYIGAVVVLTVNEQIQPPIPGSEPSEVFPTVLGNARLKLEAQGDQFSGPDYPLRQRITTIVSDVQGLTVKGIYVNTKPVSVVSVNIIPLTVAITEAEENG